MYFDFKLLFCVFMMVCILCVMFVGKSVSLTHCYKTRYNIAILGSPRESPTSVTRVIYIPKVNVTVTSYWLFPKKGKPESIYQELSRFDPDGIFIPAYLPLNESIRYRIMSLRTKSCSCLLINGFIYRYGSEKFDDRSRKEASSPSKVDNHFNKANLFLSMVDHLKWRNAIILYDASLEREIGQLTSGLTQTKFLLYHVCLPGPSSSVNDPETCRGQKLRSITQQLSEFLSPQEELNFILLCSSKSTLSILDQISTSLGQFATEEIKLQNNSRWLVSVSLHANRQFFSSLNGLDNVAVVDFQQDVVAYPRTCATQNLIKMVTDCLPQEVISHLTPIFDGKLTADDLFLTFSRILDRFRSDCPVAPVETLYHGKDRLLYFGHVGLIAPDLSMEPMESDSAIHHIYPNTNFGFNHRLVKVGLLQESPFVMKRQVNNKTTYEGFCIDVLRLLERSLNFSSIFFEPSDSEACNSSIQEGTQEGSQDFTQLTCMQHSREIDMTIVKTDSIVDMEEGTDYYWTFYADVTTVIMRRTDPDDRKWFAIFRPFKWEVFAAIGLSVLVIAIMATLIERFNPAYQDTLSCFHALPFSVWNVYGILLSQGLDDLPTSVTGRTLVSFLSMFATIIAAMYSGTLMSFMTVIKESAPFNSLREMVEQDDFKFGLQGGSLLESQFKDSFDRFHSMAWQKIVDFNRSDPRVLSRDTHVHHQMVNNGHYAYIGSRSHVHEWLMADCRLVTIKQPFDSQYYGFALSNTSVYGELLRKAINRLFESGIIDVHKKLWWKENGFCPGSLVAESTTVTILEVQSVFYILIVGVIMSAMLLSVEAIVQNVIMVFRRKSEDIIVQSIDALQCSPQTDILEERSIANKYVIAEADDVIVRYVNSLFEMDEDLEERSAGRVDDTSPSSTSFTYSSNSSTSSVTSTSYT